LKVSDEEIVKKYFPKLIRAVKKALPDMKERPTKRTLKATLIECIKAYKTTAPVIRPPNASSKD
jgi:vacuolar-type H+-ATPase subunit E/Vma4